MSRNAPPKETFFRGSVAWHPERRLRRRLSLHGRKMHPAGLLGQRFFLKKLQNGGRRFALIRVFQVTKGHSSPLKKDNETRIRNGLWDPKKITSQNESGWFWVASHGQKQKIYKAYDSCVLIDSTISICSVHKTWLEETSSIGEIAKFQYSHFWSLFKGYIL